MKLRPGHTLVELTVILTVLGVMGALVAPAWRETRRDSRLEASARALVALLDEARLAAEERGTIVTLILDPATGRAWYAADGLDAPPERAGTLPLSGTVLVESMSPRVRFVFVPGGLALGTPLRLRDGVDTRVVTVDPWSGEVHVGAD